LLAEDNIIISQATTSKKTGLFRIALTVSIIAIVGKLLGFAREAVIAAYYGANSSTDAFFFAQNMPAMLFPAVCNSISTAFLSLYVQKKIKDGQRQADIFASKTLSASLVLAAVLSLFALIFTPYIVPVFAPGFSGETLYLAIKLTRLIMGAFVLTMSIYIFSAVLNANRLFYAVQIAGFLCNFVIIVITLFLGKGQSVEFLTLTVIIGYLANAFVLYVYCRSRTQISLSNPYDKAVKSVLVLALPILLGNSVVQLQTIVDKALASGLPSGSISFLSYCASLNSLVTAVIITSLSTVLYPTLAENASSDNMPLYVRHIHQSIVMMTIVLLPVTIITVFFSSDIISFIFKRGNFNENAVRQTSLVLAFYAPAYVFIGIREIMARAFYAIQDTRTPMINGAIAVIFHILCSIILVRSIGIIGIPIGATISSLIASALLIFNASRKIKGMYFRGFCSSIIKAAIAGCVVAVLMFALSRFLLNVAVPIVRIFAAATVGVCVYSAVLLSLRCDEAIIVAEKIKAVTTAVLRIRREKQ